jgi:hypothetical protein
LAEPVGDLREYFDKKPRTDVNHVEYKWLLILNYLDAIAIGVEQGLYIEELAKVHLKNIVNKHVNHAFISEGLLKDYKDDYLKLCDMNDKWQRDKSYYHAYYTFRFRRFILHPGTILSGVLIIVAAILLLGKAHASVSS